MTGISLPPYLANQYILSGYSINSHILDSALMSFSGILTTKVFKFDTVKFNCDIAVSHNDPYYDPSNPGLTFSKWHLDKLEASCAWFLSQGDPNIKVALVDANIKSSHPELTNKINYFVHLDDPTFNGIPKNLTNYHGTQVAGVIGAETNNNLGIGSIGYNLKLEVFEVNEYIILGLSKKELRDGVLAAWARGAKVINCSFAGPEVISIEDAKEITESGTILVFGAGNERLSDYKDDNAYIIGNIPGVIVVSATDINDDHGPTNYSYHDRVDLCAPGYELITTDGVAGYKYVYGTSFATPLVTATVGLMFSIDNGLTVEEIECILKSSCDAINDEGNGNPWQNKLGAGRLNTFKALEIVKQKFDNGTKGNITVNTVWTGQVDIIDDIVVKAGNELTINSCQITVRKGKKIIVEPDAFLNITNSSITGFQGCGINSSWGGIVVLGKGDLTPQVIAGNYNQGRIILENSTIEDAIIGIESGTNSSNSGGIIKVNNSNFNNCRVGVRFNTYLNSTDNEYNFSTINNSNFNCTNTIAGFPNEGMEFGIWMTSNRGIVLSGNSFINSIDDSKLNLYSGSKRGVAISSWESKFKVTPAFDYSVIIPNPGNCPRYPVVRRSHFEGFTTAINSHGSDHLKHTPIVLESDFLNNEINIDINNVQFSIIFNNSFIWDQNLKGLPNLGLLNCKGIAYQNQGSQKDERFYILDNTFNFIANPFINWCTYKGIELFEANTSSFHVLFRRNKIIQNKYLSNSAYMNTIGIYMGNYCDDYGINCDNYSPNLRYAWYADVNAAFFHSFQHDQQFYIASRGDGNIFNSCLNTPPGTSMNRSLYSAGTAFQTFHNNGIPNTWTHYSEYAPLTSSCLFNSNSSLLLNPNSYCNSTGFVFNYDKIYCPGPDQTPGTPDDGTENGGGNGGGGGDNGGGNPPCNPCSLKEIQSERNKILKLVVDKGLDIKLESLNLNPEIIITQAKFLSDLDSTVDMKIVRDFLNHFYGIYIPEKNPNIEFVNTQLVKKEIAQISWKVSLSPNPAFNILNLNIEESQIGSSFKYTIQDLAGRTISQVNSNSSLTTIDVYSLASGMYLINITNLKDLTNRTIKFYKQ